MPKRMLSAIRSARGEIPPSCKRSVYHPDGFAVGVARSAPTGGKKQRFASPALAQAGGPVSQVLPFPADLLEIRAAPVGGCRQLRICENEKPITPDFSS